MKFALRRAAGAALIVAAALVSTAALSTAWADQGRIITVQADVQKRVDALVKGFTANGGKFKYGSAAAEGSNGVVLKDVEMTSVDGKTMKVEAIIVRDYDWDNPEHPTKMDTSFKKLVLTGDALEKEVTDLGVTQLTINGDIAYAMDESKKTFELSTFALDVVELGEFQLKLKLAGIGAGDLKSALSGKPGEDAGTKLLAQLSVVSAAITFKDKSLTQRLIAADAKKKGMSEADAKKKMLEELAAQKKEAQDDATKEVIDLAVKFLNSPGTVELIAQPSAPANVMQVFMGLMASPAEVKKMLGLTFAVK